MPTKVPPLKAVGRNWRMRSARSWSETVIPEALGFVLNLFLKDERLQDFLSQAGFEELGNLALLLVFIDLLAHLLKLTD